MPLKSLKFYIVNLILLMPNMLFGQIPSIKGTDFDCINSASVNQESKSNTILLPYAKTATGDTVVYYWGFDTNYVKRYRDRLAVSVFQSQRSFELGLSQTEIPDANKLSQLKFIARSSKVTGISFAYDKISFSFGYTTPITESELYRKGSTKYSDYAFSFTSNKYRLELSYRNYKGFYEENTARYVKDFTDTNAYFQLPELNNMSVKAKFIYIFNKHKFSYSAAYNNTYRQLKSAGSFFAVSDIFYNSLYNPVSYFPSQVDSFYSSYKNFNSLEAYGLTIGGGYSYNLVLFRSLYVNATLGLAAQFYQQNTKSTDGIVNNNTFKAGLTGSDFRWALGYNGKNFFIRFSLAFDITLFKISTVNVNSQFVSGSFAYGYRFKFKERNWVKKMKNNKIYKII